MHKIMSASHFGGHDLLTIVSMEGRTPVDSVLEFLSPTGYCAKFGIAMSAQGFPGRDDACAQLPTLPYLR